MGHQDTYYKQNEAYAEFLAGWDAGFYAKYADTLKPLEPGDRTLDVGCGVGQVVARLTEAGFEAHGVDVSAPNIERARKFSDRCQLYDGQKLPFPDQHFASVGALNVLEHVDASEAFIQELVRVAKIGGRIVLSSPNFFRVLGFHECFQIRQARAPECAVRLQPVVHSFQRFRIQPIQAVASFPVFLNQVGAPK